MTNYDILEHFIREQVPVSETGRDKALSSLVNLRIEVERLRALVVNCQQDLAKWIVPDSGITDHGILSVLLGRLDGPESLAPKYERRLQRSL